MFYTIYKTTNLINNKFYIGKHQTKDLADGYFGSGKLLVRAVNKYGIDNFATEIVAVYETEHEMNLAEKILVVCDPEVSYNLCKGGQGGFSFINKVGLRYDLTKHIAAWTPEERAIQRERMRPKFVANGKRVAKYIIANRYRGPNPMLGKKHTDATKAKIGAASKTRPSPTTGKPRSEATRKKIADALRSKGIRPPSRKGIILAEEIKQKISNGVKAKYAAQRSAKF